MSQKYKNILNYTENLLSLASWVTRWESISTFASLVAIPTDITSSTV